ncbi:hypothetical protein A3Q32_00930 [Alcanivorax sp. KX64203]|nr:hypothetical protein A3Q32_00930 [Alcanivorax sp. KX64203]
MAVLTPVRLDVLQFLPTVTASQRPPKGGFQPAPFQGIPQGGQSLIEQGTAGPTVPGFLGHWQ